MVSPRFNRIRRTERLARETSRLRGGMIQSGRLISVDEFGGASVQIQGRFGDAQFNGLGSLVDDLDQIIGLHVSILVPSGNLRDGGFILGTASSVTALADFTNLAGGLDDLIAQDPLVGSSTVAWRGTALVPRNQTLQVTGITLVVRSLPENGIPILDITHSSAVTTFRETSFDSLRRTLTAPSPIVVQSGVTPETVTMALRIERFGGLIGNTGFDDAVLRVPYSTSFQPRPSGSSQRLQILTSAGSGLPTMIVHGRLN